MNSSETLNLNAPSVAKRPATKHSSNVHSTLVFLPVEISIYVNAAYSELEKTTGVTHPGSGK